MFVQYYVHDGILVEVKWWHDGRCCRLASVSLGSDHFRLFGQRPSRNPPLLSPRKMSPWDTVLCVLGWEIGTVAMALSVPVAKLEQLRDTLGEWHSDHTFASQAELRSLIGRLLYLREVVRPGRYLVRRRLNQVGLAPIRVWGAKFHVSHARTASSSRTRLGPEFHADVLFCRLLVSGGLGFAAGRLSAPPFRS